MIEFLKKKFKFLLLTSSFTFFFLVIFNIFLQRIKLKKKFLITKKKKQDELKKRLSFAETLPKITFIQKEKFEKIQSLSALELVKAIRNGEYKAEEVMKLYIYFAYKSNKELNCLTDALFKEALEKAKEQDKYFKETGKTVGPLHGLPISVKDNLLLKGHDSTLGVTKNCFDPAIKNAVVINALINAGAIVFCKTNVPQTLMLPETYNGLFGVTVNPYDKFRTPGGSSGGEGSLIGSGGSIVGFGTDVGGSVRIPASFCGLTTLRGTYARISKRGSRPAIPQSFIKSVIGPITTNVDDLVLIFKILYSPYVFNLDPEVSPIRFNEELYLTGPEYLEKMEQITDDIGYDNNNNNKNEDEKVVEIRDEDEDEENIKEDVDDNEEKKEKRKLRIGYFIDDKWYEPSNTSKRAMKEVVEALEENKESLNIELVEIVPPDLAVIMEIYTKLMCCDGLKVLKNYLKGELTDKNIALGLRVSQAPAWIRKLVIKLFFLMGERRKGIIVSGFGESPVDAEWVMQKEAQKNEDGFLR
eukprot:TRINITY_DN550_c0_g2_i2.p1 TRINITY_DN550_c0_g2~~TRINITY_DN550_c0_g2_i2.p1  ORF type:complete len:528 (-),score=202.00 TRINITY_DN550_c0_g2_i2:1925-3508(-)